MIGADDFLFRRARAALDEATFVLCVARRSWHAAADPQRMFDWFLEHEVARAAAREWRSRAELAARHQRNVERWLHASHMLVKRAAMLHAIASDIHESVSRTSRPDSARDALPRTARDPRDRSARSR